MHCTSGVNRPPYEAESAFLQVTSGCSHSACLFCGYFKDTGFRKSTLEEIEEDIQEIPRIFGRPKRVFLQSADAFAADFETLMQTAELIHKHVPSVKSIGGYARIDNFFDKSGAQLRAMKDAGFLDPYIGVESGDDDVLKAVHKGYTAAEARAQLEKLTEAGMSFIANFLNGIGGAGFGLSHARKTAELYEGMSVSMIEVSSLTLVPGTPLFRLREKGKFREAGEHERLREMQEFLRRLRNKTVFLSDHISVPFRVRASLPEQKQELIDGIERLIDEVPEAELRTLRDASPIM